MLANDAAAVLEARARTPKQANAAAAQSTKRVRDHANESADALALAVDRIFRKRWAEFVRAKKLDASIILDGIAAELQREIEHGLSGVVDHAASETLGDIAAAIPAEALLAIHRKHALIDLDERFAPTLDDAQLVESSAPKLSFITNASSKAKTAAYQFVALPKKADVKRIVYSKFDGKTWFDRLKNWLPVEKDLAREISNGLSLGKSRQDIARAIRPLVDGSRSSAMRIARTECHRVNVTTQMRSMDQALGPAIEGWIYTATKDSRVSDEHLKLDGTVYERGAKKPQLPSRPNCRCVYRPKMRSWDSFNLPADVVAILRQPFGGRAAA